VDLDPKACCGKIQIMGEGSWDPVFENKMLSIYIPGPEEIVCCRSFSEVNLNRKVFWPREAMDNPWLSFQAFCMMAMTLL
jgi:hypothetical protein